MTRHDLLLAFTCLATMASGAQSASVMAADAVLLRDDFAGPSSAGRRAMRGPWTFVDGIASCTQDDELYKKHKNHGPIIFYDLPFEDATITFMFKPERAKAVTFTANGEQGHIFRVSWGAKGTSVRAFPPDSKEKSVSVGQDENPLAQGVWIPVKITLDGMKATVTTGDGSPQIFEHASFGRSKTNVSVGFSFGSLNVRQFAILPGN